MRRKQTNKKKEKRTFLSFPQLNMAILVFRPSEWHSEQKKRKKIKKKDETTRRFQRTEAMDFDGELVPLFTDRSLTSFLSQLRRYSVNL